MKKPLRLGLFAVAALALTVPMIATANADEPDGAGPGIAAVTELVTNGDFANGTTGWWNGGNTSMSAATGALAVNVTGGTNFWDAPIGQDNIALTTGTTYTISFDAKASASVQARSTVQLGADPYTATHDKTLNLTTTSQHFSYTFTSTITTATGQVDFQLGNGSTYTFTVDNVSLTTGTADTGGSFYVDTDNNAYRWIGDNPGDDRIDSIHDNIAAKAGAKWFGDWSGATGPEIKASIRSYMDLADAAGQRAIVAAYNILGRDCGSYSGGGPEFDWQYEEWIDGFAQGIGSSNPIVILEPDAVAQMLTCGMSTADSDVRKRLLTYATQSLKTYAPNAWVYLDAGNAGWIDPGVMAGGLQDTGIANVRGFALNVSNYKTTEASNNYGVAINAALPTAKKFIVDTSRNAGPDADGNGVPDNTDGNWCNSRGARLGVDSQASTGPAEFLLWVKFPGDSDGKCDIFGHNDPDAGSFSPDLAQALITGDWTGV